MRRDDFFKQIQIALDDLSDNSSLSWVSKQEREKEIVNTYNFIKSMIIQQYEENTCQNCMYLGVDVDRCLKCSKSYENKFKEMIGD